MSLNSKKLHRLISPEVGDYSIKTSTEYQSPYYLNEEERAVRRFYILNQNCPFVKDAFNRVILKT